MPSSCRSKSTRSRSSDARVRASNPGEKSLTLSENFFNAPGCSIAVRPRARRICLDELDVQSGDVVWDVGAGTGSVSLVSALNHPDTRYYALEESPRLYRTLLRNVYRLGISNVIPCHGRAPEDLDQLPPPDAIYLGGTGGRVRQITGAVASALGGADRLVASFVVERNYARCWSLLRDRGFRITSRTMHFDLTSSGNVHFLMAQRIAEQRF